MENKWIRRMTGLFALALLALPQTVWADYETPEIIYVWNESSDEKVKTNWTLSLNNPYVQFTYMFCERSGSPWDGTKNGRIILKNTTTNDTILLATYHSKGSGSAKEAELEYSRRTSNYGEEHGWLEFVETYHGGSKHSNAEMARWRYYPGSEITKFPSEWELHIKYDWDIDCNGFNDTKEAGQGPRDITCKFDVFNSTLEPVLSNSRAKTALTLERVLDSSGAKQLRGSMPELSYSSIGNKRDMEVFVTSGNGYGKGYGTNRIKYYDLGDTGTDAQTFTVSSSLVNGDLKLPLTLFYYLGIDDRSLYAAEYYAPVSKVEMPGFYYPTNLTVKTSDKWTRTAIVKWTGTSKDPKASKEGRWYVYRSQGTSGEPELLTPNGLDFNVTEYTDVVPSLETEYTYTVCYAMPEWKMTKPVDDLKTTKTFNMKCDFRFSGKRARANTASSSTVHIEFTHDRVPSGSECRIKLYHDNDGQLLKTWEWDAGHAGNSVTETFEHNTGSAQRDEHRYHLEAELLGCTVRDNESFSGTVAGTNTMTSLEASRGTYNNSVRLTWHASIRNANVKTYYYIERREMEGDAGFQNVATVESTATIGTWEDTQVEPGSFYEYRVTQKTREDALNEDGEVDTDAGQVELVSSQLTTDGFGLSSGVISGRITYGTGSAVENVVVNIEPDQDEVQQQFYALSGKTTEADTLASVQSSKLQTIFDSRAYTLQMWVRLNADAGTCVLAKMGDRELWAQKTGDGEWGLLVNGSEQLKSMSLRANRYYFVTLRRTGNADFTISLCGDEENAAIVSEQVTSLSAFAPREGLFAVGASRAGDQPFSGLIDEVRLWNRVLTDDDIRNTYDRPLAGSEQGLSLYWPFDEGLTYLLHAYDYSKTDNVSNSLHGDVAHEARGIALTPGTLRLYGRTDASGNYIVRGIPFMADGTNYVVRPTKNLHEFLPSFETRFVSSGSLSHSGVNMTDVSSFEVTGEVFYENTRCPVVGAALYVDGNTVMRNGSIVLTNADGEFTIDVPIGDHYIEIRKDGHTFLNGGRYPSGSTTHYFDEGITGLRFTDQTLVPVVGRVVGGLTEANKPLGLGLSTANIGQAEIVLDGNNPLNVTEKAEGTTTTIVANTTPRELPQASAYVDSRAYVVAADAPEDYEQTNAIHITTDPRTGEFAAMLPPLVYRVTSVRIPSNPDIDFGVDATLFNCTQTVDFAVDSLITTSGPLEEKISQTFSYSAALTKTYHSTPVMRVEDLNNRYSEYGVFGQDSCRYVLPNGAEAADRIPAYTFNEADKTFAYTFGYPILDSYSDGSNLYDIKVYEPFENRDNAPDILYYEEPAKNIVVEVTNEFSSTEPVWLEGEDRGVRSQTTTVTELTTDSTGVARYEFYTGLPNINGDHTLKMEITYEIDGVQHSWDQNGLFKVIVLGDLTRGNNFTTMGPDKINYVLRDPPGTASTASLTAGSTITNSDGWSVPFTAGSSFTLVKKTITQLQRDSQVGLAEGVISPMGGPVSLIVQLHDQRATEVDVTSLPTANLSYNHTEGRTTTTTTVLNETFSTDGTANFVGANGDVFFGNSTNVTLGESTFLNIYEKQDGTYQLDTREGQAASVEFGTMFVYTQQYIEKTLLPQQETGLKELLYTVSPEDYAKIGPYSQLIDQPYYFTTLSPDDPRFGSLNSDSLMWGDLAVTTDDEDYFDKGQSYKMVTPLGLIDEYGDTIKAYTDMVAFYNNSIRNWKSILAQNEEDKYTAIYQRKDYINQNVSFSSGVGYTNSSTTKTTNAHNWSNSFTVSASWAQTKEFNREARRRTAPAKVTRGEEIMDRILGEVIDRSMFRGGRTVKLQWTATPSVNISPVFTGSEVQDTTTTVTYNLRETDVAEALSVDVLKSPQGWGPVFYTRGGQTSGPWEDEVVAKYFEPQNHYVLSQATEKVDDPWIQFDRTTATGVPVGQPARFMVKVCNQSATGTSRLFNFGLVPNTNTHGAVCFFGGKRDGGSLLLGPNETEIELLIYQSDQSVLDYDLRFFMMAQSQTGGNFGPLQMAVPLSVHFVQSSSPVELASSVSTINTEGDSTVTMRVHDFDRGYRALKAVQLLYRYEGDQQYTILQEWICDSSYTSTAQDAQYIGESVSDVSYVVDMHSKAMFPDGHYYFKARTLSGAMDDLKHVDSDELVLVKDIEKPRLMGLPSPSSGILGPGDMISLRFNETLRPITDKDLNLLVTGERNGSTIADQTALQLTAGEPVAATAANLQLARQDFAGEMWVNLSQGGGTLLQHGTEDNHFRLSVDAEGYLLAEFGNAAALRSQKPMRFARDTYLYYCYQYNGGEPQFHAAAVTADQTDTLFQRQPAPAYDGFGRLALGGGQLEGRIHDMTLWGQARSLTTSLTQRNYTKTAQTPGLIGYWRMNEGRGTEVRDYVQNRNLSAPAASWWLDTDNLAASFADDSFLTMYSPGTLFDDESNDYAVEFWMRSDGNQQGDAVLLGSAKSLSGTDSLEMALQLGAEGALKLVTADKEELIYTVGTDLQDGGWHHLALNVLRNGTSAFYIDGQLRRNLLSADIPTLRGRYLTLGGKNFRGDMDEFRYWRASMAGEMLVGQRYEQLDTAAARQRGLTLYLPFESRQLDEYQQVVTLFTTDDQSGNSGEGKNSGTQGFDHVAKAASAPGLKAAPTLVNLNFDFVQNDEEIVVDLSQERMRDIEGQTVYVTVSNLRDLNGNYCEPVSFQVYVNQATLKWETDRLDMEQTIAGEEAAASLSFANQSGKGTHWYLTNVPGWLTVSEVQGSIDPLSTLTITASVAPGTPIGRYQDIIYLLGDDGILQPLPVSLRVSGQRPDWQVVDLYQENMAVVAQAVSEGRICNNDQTLVAAFNQADLCVGLASPQYNSRFDTYFVMMTVYGSGADKLTFRIWDADNGQIYPFTDLYLGGQPLEVAFSSNALVGSLQQPLTIVATDANEQRLVLKRGWNWMSLYVRPADGKNTPDVVFGDKLGASAQVKSKTTFAQRSSSIWFANESNPLVMQPGEMYKVQSGNDADISLVGQTLTPSAQPLTIVPNYNWIGYNANFRASLADAFADLGPADGDVVRSKTAFAIYDSNEWVGTLTQLVPGEGYVYYNSTGETRTFRYPDATMQRNAPRRAPEERAESHYQPIDDSAYPGNMTLIVRIEDGGNIVADAEVAAFVDDECRASSQRTAAGGLHFMTIPGQGSGGRITFRVWTGEAEYLSDPSLTYADDAMLGTPEAPVVVDLQNCEVGIASLLAGGGAERVYDMQGRKMGSKKPDSRLSRGVYLHQTQQGARKVVVK